MQKEKLQHSWIYFTLLENCSTPTEQLYIFLHGICQQFIGGWNMHRAHRPVTKPSLYGQWDP